MSTNIDVNAEIRGLVERWCDRREYRALAIVLPSWIANDGLTDGWGALRDALRHAYSAGVQRPDERELLKTLYVEIDVGLRNR